MQAGSWEVTFDEKLAEDVIKAHAGLAHCQPLNTDP
jgi:hypothetical protein